MSRASESTSCRIQAGMQEKSAEDAGLARQSQLTQNDEHDIAVLSPSTSGHGDDQTAAVVAIVVPFPVPVHVVHDVLVEVVLDLLLFLAAIDVKADEGLDSVGAVGAALHCDGHDATLEGEIRCAGLDDGVVEHLVERGDQPLEHVKDLLGRETVVHGASLLYLSACQAPYRMTAED